MRTEGTSGVEGTEDGADRKTMKEAERGTNNLPVGAADLPRHRDGRFVRADAVERFWSKVEVGEHWLWRGGTTSDGYGRFTLPGGGEARAHRWAYEAMVGPIPEGLTLDHLCGVTLCVRPAHLEPCTAAENLRRRHARQRASEHELFVLNVAHIVHHSTRETER